MKMQVFYLYVKIHMGKKTNQKSFWPAIFASLSAEVTESCLCLDYPM